jgi:GT2 family glycosyltransferase
MRLSIVIVAYRSREVIPACLGSLPAASPELEIIVVDNGPDDGTRGWLRQARPDVRLLVAERNGGYAGGNNLGIAAASGDWVLILNPDTQLVPGALDVLLETAEHHPLALVTPKLLLADGTVNACGNEMHYTGITTCRGIGADAAAITGLHPVPLVSGAAMLVPRRVLLDLGGFDDTYFMYHEDTDLSLRAKLRGHPLLCAADAEVVHDYDLGMNPTKFGFLTRNRLRTLFKVYEGRTLRRLALGLVLTEAATIAYACLRGHRYLTSLWRAYQALWRERRQWLAQRRIVQSTREVSDHVLLADCVEALPFAQLVPNAVIARILDTVTTPLYRPMLAWARGRSA